MNKMDLLRQLRSAISRLFERIAYILSRLESP